MANKSLMDVAYDVLKKSYEDNGNKSVPMKFSDLLLAVGQEIGMEKEDDLLKIASRFYTDLTLDGRFVIKENNTWVLREHEKFEDIHIDMNEVYSLDEYEDDDKPAHSSDEDSSDEEGEEKKSEDEEEELGEESGSDMSMDDDEDENN